MASRLLGGLRDFATFVFLSAPFRYYDAGVRAGGAVPWSFLVVYLLVCVGAGVAGAAVGVVTDRPLEDSFWGGFVIGTFVMLTWILYVVVVLLVVPFIDLIPGSRAERRDAWGAFVGLLHRRGERRRRHRRGNHPE